MRLRSGTIIGDGHETRSGRVFNNVVVQQPAQPAAAQQPVAFDSPPRGGTQGSILPRGSEERRLTNAPRPQQQAQVEAPPIPPYLSAGLFAAFGQNVIDDEN